MNPAEQKSHKRVTDDLERRIDDLETIVVKLDERLSEVSLQTHTAIADSRGETDRLVAILHRRLVGLEQSSLERLIIVGPRFVDRCQLAYRVVRWFFTGQAWRHE